MHALLQTTNQGTAMPTYSAVSATERMLLSYSVILTDRVGDLLMSFLVNSPTDDHSRVHLIPVEGAEHDYVNANFIDVR